MSAPAGDEADDPFSDSFSKPIGSDDPFSPNEAEPAVAAALEAKLSAVSLSQDLDSDGSPAEAAALSPG